MKWEHSAGLVPFISDRGHRKYLLILSSLTKSELWEFPKGHIEEGEDALTAASREFREEAGISEFKIIPGFRKVLKYFYRRDAELIGKTVTYFLCIPDSNQVRLSSEGKDYLWATPERALGKIKQKNLRDLLKYAESYLQNNLSRK